MTTHGGTHGTVLVRCPLCEELRFDPRTGKCTDPRCEWDGQCVICHGPLDEPLVNRYCSSDCHGIALDEQHAELMRDDGGL